MARGRRGEVLGLALLRGHLRARVYHDGAVAASWEHPDMMAGLQGLEEALEEMQATLRYDGSSVVVAISSSQVVHHSLKVPPMTDRDLRAYLARKARIETDKEERPAWGYRPLRESLKGERSVLLQVLPAAMVEVFLKFCDRHGFEIDLVVPISASLVLQAQKAPVPVDSWVLVAGEAEGATTVVLAQPGGDLALVRELPYGWSDGAALDRVGRELNRSLLFAKQQFGVVARSVWLAGPGATEAKAGLAAFLETPIEVVPGADPTDLWLSPLLDAHWTISDNLVPESRRKLRSKRGWVAAALVASIALAVAVVVAWSWFLAHEKDLASQVAAVSIESRTATLLQERQNLEAAATAHALLLAQSRYLDSAGARPLPGWFQGFLSQAVPADLYLRSTLFSVDTTTGAWKARIEGLGPRNAVKLAASLRLLQQRLEKGVPGWITREPWSTSWFNGLRNGGNVVPDSVLANFSLEGGVR